MKVIAALIVASALTACSPMDHASVSMNLARTYDGGERKCKQPRWLECDGVMTPSEVAGGH